jgi:hypothetical protein
MFNRQTSPLAASKPAVLLLASRIGLPIPQTRITNVQVVIASMSDGHVAKPVGGGDFCYDLAELLPRVQFRNGAASVPSIVQNRLVGPEIRIYVIGDRTFAFEMRSKSIDYRLKQDVEVIPVAPVPGEVQMMIELMHKLGLNSAAADFKTDSRSGRLIFLELNTCPMIARFSYATNGTLADAMIDWLMNNG